jgi:hypothetical protein
MRGVFFLTRCLVAALALAGCTMPIPRVSEGGIDAAH